MGAAVFGGRDGGTAINKDSLVFNTGIAEVAFVDSFCMKLSCIREASLLLGVGAAVASAHVDVVGAHVAPRGDLTVAAADVAWRSHMA